MSDGPDILIRSHARVGTVLLGKYRIDRVLGAGGMAVVYAVTHRNRQTFALKMLHAELSLQPDIRTRFLREGYVANSVQHKGAVKVLDDDVAEDGSAFLVMELLEGEPVDKVWERNRLRMPPAAVLALAHQLLDVLAAAHKNAVVHRDIKPANLFLTREGALKVLDFGIARLRERTETTTGLTQGGGLLGTPVFMAPEQALGRSEEIDGRTDLWSVGATLFSLLSGETVHVGRTLEEVLVQAATRPARSLAKAAPDIPQRIVALVDRALAFDKADRWNSAAEMRDAIRDTYLAEFSTVVSEEPLRALVEGSRAGGGASSSAPTVPSNPPSALGAVPPGEFRDMASGGTRTYAPSSHTQRQSLPPRAGWALPAASALGLSVLLGGGLLIARAVHEPSPGSIPGSTDTGVVGLASARAKTVDGTSASTTPASSPGMSAPIATPATTGLAPLSEASPEGGAPVRKRDGLASQANPRATGHPASPTSSASGQSPTEATAPVHNPLNMGLQ